LLKITIFGLTLSSSWGNGHATPYRAILRALARRGIRISFYEKDAPYYARHRDFASCDYCDLRLYSHWSEVRAKAMAEARDSDIVITASYCPEGARINDDVLELAAPLRCFYDLDTPITLNHLGHMPLDYVRPEQIPEFDLYLSFAGGDVLTELERTHGARMARALYGCVDPDEHHRVPRDPNFACALSYLGTFAADRQHKVDELFLEPACRRGDLQFILAGALYPCEWTWPENVRRIEHLASGQHPALYCSSRATLNLTRSAMAASGYCPSGRFFEAAACGCPILTDGWRGLDTFFDPERELCIVRDAADVFACLDGGHRELEERAETARRRTLDEHTGVRRAKQLLSYCEEAYLHKPARAEATA